MKMRLVHTCPLAGHPPGPYNTGTGARGSGGWVDQTFWRPSSPSRLYGSSTVITINGVSATDVGMTVVGGTWDGVFGVSPTVVDLTPAPRTPAVPPVVVHPTHRAHGEGNPTGKTLYTVLGYPLCSVLRFLGHAGYTPSQARAVCTMAGVNPSKHTITTQLQHGRHGRHGIPELSEDVQMQLMVWSGR